jgi:hypothetical protein
MLVIFVATQEQFSPIYESSFRSPSSFGHYIRVTANKGKVTLTTKHHGTKL